MVGLGWIRVGQMLVHHYLAQWTRFEIPILFELSLESFKINGIFVFALISSSTENRA